MPPHLTTSPAAYLHQGGSALNCATLQPTPSEPAYNRIRSLIRSWLARNSAITASSAPDVWASQIGRHPQATLTDAHEGLQELLQAKTSSAHSELSSTWQVARAALLWVFLAGGRDTIVGGGPTKWTPPRFPVHTTSDFEVFHWERPQRG